MITDRSHGLVNPNIKLIQPESGAFQMIGRSSVKNSEGGFIVSLVAKDASSHDLASML
jgi:hypothetical protein